ncbi:MAG TPA: alpha/beta hydrolase-fold protein [Candidatus Acidoferrum sp.]
MSSGQLRKHDKFRSRYLRNQRDLIVYLPPGYDEQPDRRFPVLYLHDGQNLFDRATSFAGQDWNVQGAADDLINAGSVAPLIVVGIYNTGKSRIHEYTPTKAPKLGGGRADRYAKFLLQEVMPFIQNEYRADPNPLLTGIGGSSLGGLVSLYVGLKLPHSFGKIAALSPSVWWNQRVILRFAATVRVDSHPLIWLDIGTKEGPRIVPDVEQFRDVLIQKGWSLGQDLHYERIEGGEHNEWAWSQRIGRVLEFLYPAHLLS